MSERYAAVLATPLPGQAARLGLALQDGALAGIVPVGNAVALREPAEQPAVAAARWLRAYFGDPDAPIELDPDPAGTAYQRRVWAALRAIRRGQTRTYAELAGGVGGNARSVGGACRGNPLPILIPCHRVVAAGGLGGYMGATRDEALAIKSWLLSHERGA